MRELRPQRPVSVARVEAGRGRGRVAAAPEAVCEVRGVVRGRVVDVVAGSLSEEAIAAAAGY